MVKVAPKAVEHIQTITRDIVALVEKTHGVMVHIAATSMAVGRAVDLVEQGQAKAAELAAGVVFG